MNASGDAPAGLQVRREGAEAGTPIVFSHALGMDLTMWDEMAARFAPRHPVLRYDHRGQGRSAPASAAYGIDDLVDDAAALIRGWGRGPVVFVGLSMGGVVGQGLALRHPALVRGLLLANTAARYADDARQGLRKRAADVRAGGMPAVVDAILERFLSAGCRAARPELEALVRSTLLRADPAGYALACEAIAGADWLPHLAEIACPVRLIAGLHDPGATPEMTQAIAAHIPGARVAALAAAHLSVLEQPRPFAAELDGLLTPAG